MLNENKLQMNFSCTARAAAPPRRPRGAPAGPPHGLRETPDAPWGAGRTIGPPPTSCLTQLVAGRRRNPEAPIRKACLDPFSRGRQAGAAPPVRRQMGSTEDERQPGTPACPGPGAERAWTGMGSGGAGLAGEPALQGRGGTKDRTARAKGGFRIGSPHSGAEGRKLG